MKQSILQVVRLLVLLVLLDGTLQAQSIVWSAPQRITSRNYYTDILGKLGDNLFLVQTGKLNKANNVELVKLAADMRESKRQTFLTQKNQYLVRAALMKGRLLLFYAIRDRKKKEIGLYCKSIGIDLQEITEDKLLASIPLTGFRKGLFRVVISNDKKRVLVTLPENVERIENNLLYQVYRQDLSILTKGKLSHDVPDAKLRNSTFADSCFVATLHLEEKKKGERTKKRFLYYHQIGEGTEGKIELFQGQKSALNGKLIYHKPAKTIMYSAFYQDKDSLEGAIGLYRLSLNLDSLSATQHYQPFPASMVVELFGKNYRAEDFSTLSLRHMVPRSDGGQIIISERSIIDEQVMSNPEAYGLQETYSRTYFYFYEISVLSLNADGTLDWHEAIKKDQVSLNDDGYYSSFGMQINPNRINLVYNDMSPSSGNAILHSIDPNGSDTNKILVNSDDFDGYLIPSKSVQCSNGELYVPAVTATSKSQVVIAKIRFF